MDTKKENINLKAYEYKCPYCLLTNTRCYETTRIVCDYCRKEFYANAFIIYPSIRTESKTLEIKKDGFSIQ